MQKLHYSIIIHAPRERVWHAMLDDATYRDWTKAFHEGSYFKGNWEKGSKILFVGADPATGKEAGMVARIADHRSHEFISIEHVGMYHDGVEDTTGPEVRKWAPAFENYTFRDAGGGRTELVVDMDMDEQHAEAFDTMWKDALRRLKGIAEGA